MTPLKNPIAWIAGSIGVNILLWGGLAMGTNRQVASSNSQEIYVERVVIDQQGHKTLKVVEPKKIKEVVKKLREKPPSPQLPEPKFQPKPEQKPPDPGHNKLITAKTDTPLPAGPIVLPGGNVKQGAPVIQQPGQGGGTAPAGPKPDPTSIPLSPKPDPTPAPPPKPDAIPTPPPPSPTSPPAPTPPPAPKPKGPSRDAEPVSTVQPTIPEELLSQNFKKSVRVRVHIAPDGSFTVELRQTCGNADVDKLAMDALRRWKWRPKLVDGEPQPDTQTFRFEFEVK